LESHKFWQLLQLAYYHDEASRAEIAKTSASTALYAVYVEAKARLSLNYRQIEIAAARASKPRTVG